MSNVVQLGVIITAPVRLIPEQERNIAARIRSGECTPEDIERLYLQSCGFADWMAMCGRKIWQHAVTAKPE